MAGRPLIGAAEDMRLVVWRRIACISCAPVSIRRSSSFLAYFFFVSAKPPHAAAGHPGLHHRLGIQIGHGSSHLLLHFRHHLLAAAAPDRARPKKARASSGVQSMSILTFIWAALSFFANSPVRQTLGEFAIKFRVESFPGASLYAPGLAWARKDVDEQAAQSPGRGNQPLSAAAQGQSGALAGLGSRGAWPRPGARTSRSCSRSATPPVIGAMSWPMRASRTPATAALMNELYVNIKVDREERPDLDAIYQAALALLGQQGGWPLTMFLTPDAKPFWGGTYFPPEERWGRPGFPAGAAGHRRGLSQRSPNASARTSPRCSEALAKLAEPKAGAPASPRDPRPHRRTLAAGSRHAAWRHRRRAEVSASSGLRTALARRQAQRRAPLSATPCI